MMNNYFGTGHTQWNTYRTHTGISNKVPITKVALHQSYL